MARPAACGNLPELSIKESLSMKALKSLSLISMVALVAACGGPEPETRESGSADPQVAPQQEVQKMATGQSVEIEPGLDRKIVTAGHGDVAQAGQIAVVHYTGWLYDEVAADNRGDKFDSSVDRGQHFEFPIGAGRVIQGWDRGVAGMRVGEVRELTIAPELAYGSRGAGDVIPPGATLVFEVELAALKGDPGQ
jgi:FKBP-type peptidyl-prolyl cis-trans isomerase FkpA